MAAALPVVLESFVRIQVVNVLHRGHTSPFSTSGGVSCYPVGFMLIKDRDDAPFSNHGQFQGLKLIPNPPDLEQWRERLFHVDDMITLTEEQ